MHFFQYMSVRIILSLSLSLSLIIPLWKVLEENYKLSANSL